MPYCLPSTCVHAEGAGVDLCPSTATSAVMSLTQAGLDLLGQPPPPHDWNRSGDVALLEERRELGLERLVLEDV